MQMKELFCFYLLYQMDTTKGRGVYHEPMQKSLQEKQEY